MHYPQGTTEQNRRAAAAFVVLMVLSFTVPAALLFVLITTAIGISLGWAYAAIPVGLAGGIIAYNWYRPKDPIDREIILLSLLTGVPALIVFALVLFGISFLIGAGPALVVLTVIAIAVGAWVRTLK